MTAFDLDAVSVPYSAVLHPMLRDPENATYYLQDALEDTTCPQAVEHALDDIRTANNGDLSKLMAFPLFQTLIAEAERRISEPPIMPLDTFQISAEAVARENTDLFQSLAEAESAEPAYFDDDEALQALEHVMDEYDATFRILADH